MKVSASKPFQIVYSLFQHEYLGYLFESFVVKLDDNLKLTLQHQNISSQNAREFAKGLDENDYQLIELMDSMQQETVIKHFNKQRIKPRIFFDKVFNAEKKDDLLIAEIHKYLERRRSKILPLLIGKLVFEMGRDGEPTWKELEVLKDKATVLFHFRKNEDNTHYFPTIKYGDQKVEFNGNGSYIICKSPAWLVVDGRIYHFEKDVDGNKLVPFIKKKFIVIPKNVEETYYKKFVAPLIAAFDVYAKGFEIKTEKFPPCPQLSFSELAENTTLTLFNQNGNGNGQNDILENDSKILFELSFDYGKYNFSPGHSNGVTVTMDKVDGQYIFNRVKRNLREEENIISLLHELGLEIKNSKCTVKKMRAFEWMANHKETLEQAGFKILQKNTSNKKYFLGTSSISIEVKENIDWFDIFAVIKFGEFEIPFVELRKLILKKKNEFVLPNGEIGVIPESWIKEYSELFAFSGDNNENEQAITLKKHHLALVQELESGNLAKVTIDRKLQKLRNFQEIEDAPSPDQFNGDLRPYQKAGYNWLKFLNQYRFGGCLADDMGLGKTVQTLALMQSLKESGETVPSLLIMPTSLIYNWEMEAKKFTPNLKIYCYTGTNRIKDVKSFVGKDLILTSYGITRLDIDILKEFYFNYVILDESQAIKNPNSIISKSVRELNSKHKLILTGTPLENSTMDLWAQISFINPGLLGGSTFFRNEFLLPIEKKKDTKKTQKLHNIIKPFILRRHKSQVATELPEKVENVKYCSMTTMQEEYYEEVKSQYRNVILEQIEQHGMGKSQMMLLQGLTKLRQIANHPKMIDPEYGGDSGKMEDVTYMIQSALSEDHKILIFSQFVKHLQIFSDYLKSHKIDFAYLDGSTKDRMGQVEKFQNDDNIKLFLISLKAGGLGLNLTKAEYVFLLDPWWNPAIEAQAVDRAHRIGQKNTVFTYKFITKNSVEEKILALQQHKRQLATDLIVTEDSFVKDLSKEDIELLFE